MSLLSKLNNHNSLSLSSSIRCSTSTTTLVSLHQPLPIIFVSLLYWIDQI